MTEPAPTLTVIGVDPSLTRTGVAVWVGGRCQTFSIVTKLEHGPRVIRERIICARIMPLVGSGGPSVIVMVEAVHLSSFHGRTSLDLAGLHDVLVYELHCRGVLIGVVIPQNVKQFATGNGNASKAQMLDMAHVLGVSPANHDEADGMWLMAMGVVKTGGQMANGWPPQSDHPIAVANQKQRAEALAKVQWIGEVPQGGRT